jgi:RNA 2',3'-cyclic 3'-phosphodiesterase
LTSNIDVKVPRHARPRPRGPVAADPRPPSPDTTVRGRDASLRAPAAPPPAPAAGASSRPAPSSPHLRLFVALEFPPAARDALVAFRDAAADPDVWRPIAGEAIHLTLAFLGRRPEHDVPTIDDVLRAAAGPAPRLALGRALLLPPRRARVLCASLEDLDGTLADLQGHVSDGLAAAGVYVPEKRPFRAHATVARLRSRARAPRAVDAAPEPVEFAGEALTLFVSRLHPHGARYEPLVRLKLH